MNTLRCAVAWVLSSLLVLTLAGCDIKEDIRYNPDTTPIGGGGGGDLDEQSDDNVAAFFYAGKPVRGLLYSCSRSNVVEYNGETDNNGKFVCPRDTTASFFVGKVRTRTLKLGQVDLSIFGISSSPAKRVNVVITPATLYGTSTLGSKWEVQNIFNLLLSLDVRTAGTESIVNLDANMMQVLSELEDFEVLATLGDRIGTNPSVFNTALINVTNELADQGVRLRHLEDSGSPTLGTVAAVDAADAALLRARAGLYRTNTTMLESLDAAIFIGTTEFMVGAGGVAAGYAITEEYSSANSTTTYLLNILTLNEDARVLPDGNLEGFSFGSVPRQLDFFGTLINDAIWGETRLCRSDSPNEFVPEVYCKTPEEEGGFTQLDAGSFESSLGFAGDLFIGQPLSSRPDVDLELLPADYLPKTFEAELQRYTDIQFGDLWNSSYDESGEDKAAFGPLAAMPDDVPKKIRYTLLPNGDVVSDVDNDCQTVEVAAGHYQDIADGSREFLIGRVGSVLESTPAGSASPRKYVEFYLNVVDADHPNFGFSLGLPSLYRSGLHGILLEVTGNFLRSKRCDPATGGTCTHVIEWFDNVRYAQEVYAFDRTTSALTPVDALNYKNVPYFGQVLPTGNKAVEATLTPGQQADPRYNQHCRVYTPPISG